MSDKTSTSAAENAAGASSASPASNAAAGEASTAAPKKPAAQGNPALRMMGIPRIRLPSRNWLIFFSITGGFASAVIYDKYQTRRNRQKWCDLVSHISEEHLDSHVMPRRMTIYLAAPPGDGLRTAREHFHNYVKPVLVSASMDWDVIEGRKEGDVRFKTAERIRKKRKKAGEGEPLSQEEAEDLVTLDAIREKNGTREYDGIAGDLVIGRNTWKEYISGLHEGWLGPVDPPKQPEPEADVGSDTTKHITPSHPGLGDAAVKAATNTLTSSASNSAPDSQNQTQPPADDASPQSDNTGTAETPKEEDKEEEKLKPRQPPPYILPPEYSTATASAQTPDLIGPSIGIRHPHILGFRNTPIRIYRFLTRRHLADSIGRDVAAAVMASYRPYAAADGDNGSSSSPEQLHVLEHEERDWWKTTFQPRKAHEESLWIDDMVLDERIASRMHAFQLTAEDEDRAKRLGDGREKVKKVEEREER